MGDDCFAPHERIYSLNGDANYMDLLECVKNDHYFPTISGNNVVWVMANEQYSCICSYFTLTDKGFMGLAEKSLKNICHDSNRLKFKYYSSPQRWKDSIYRMYNNDEYAMWKDGWKEEIEYCNFLINQ